MPIPKSQNVGKIMDFLKKDKPMMSKGQMLAIALDTARRAGNKSIKKRGKK